MTFSRKIYDYHVFTNHRYLTEIYRKLFDFIRILCCLYLQKSKEKT